VSAGHCGLVGWWATWQSPYSNPLLFSGALLLYACGVCGVCVCVCVSIKPALSLISFYLEGELE
jgi:hypothetical protein